MKKNTDTKNTWILQDSYLNGHTGAINSVATKGGIIASASDDNTVRIWDKNSLKEIATLYGHCNPVKSIIFLNCDILISGSYDTTIKIWNVNNGECLRTLIGEKAVVTSIVALNDDFIAGGYANSVIKIWNIKSGECRWTLKGHKATIASVAILNNNQIVSGSYDKTIKIWDIKSGECLQTLTPDGDNDGITSIAAIDENRIVVSGSTDNKTIKIWDIKSGECLQTLNGHNNFVSSITILDENRVVSGSYDKTIKIWDIESGECLKTLGGNRDWITSIATLDENRVVSGSTDKTIKIWDIETGECLKTLNGDNDRVASITILDENRVVSSSGGETIKILDIKSGECIETLEWHNRRIALIVTLDENRVVSGSYDGTIKIWDIKNGECLQTIRGHNDPITSIAILDENRAVSGSIDRTIKIWDVKSGECLQTLEGHSSSVTSVAVIDENRAVSGSYDGTIKIWDISDLKNPKILYDIPRANRGLAVDGDTLYIIEHDGAISAFDISKLPDMEKIAFEPNISPKRPIGSINARDGLISMGSISGDLIVQKIETNKSSGSIGKHIEHSFYIKTLLLGDSGVGKTTLGYFLEHQTHNQNIASTHGMRFFEFGVDEKIAYDNESKNGNFVFNVWDFGGQPEYQVAHKQNFDGARVILLVVDLERKGDEDNSIWFWINTIKEHLHKTKKEQLGVFVVGTKSGECTALDSIKARIESEISDLKGRVYTSSCDTKNSNDKPNPADKLKGSIKEHIKNHFAISNEKLLFSDSLLALEHIKEKQKERFWTLANGLMRQEYNDGALNAALDFLSEMGSIERLGEYLILKPYWKNILATSILRKAQNNEQVVGAIAKRDLYRYDFDVTFDKLLDDDSAAKSDETLYKEFLENKERKLKNLYICEIVSNFLTDKICYVKNGMFVFPSRFRNKHKEYEMDGYHRVEGINLVSKRNVEVTIATVVCSIFYSGKYDVLKHLESGVKIRDKKGNEFFVEFGREDIFVHTKNQDSASIIIHSKTSNEKSDEKAEKQLVKFVTAVLNSCLEPLYSVKSYKIKNGNDFVGEATFVVKNSAFVDESKNKYGDFSMEKIDDTSLMIDGRDIVEIEERIKKEQERVENEIESVDDGATNESKDSFVILHLSDLHFTKETKIDNEILLLKHDAANIECYKGRGLKAVDYIVLSGDLSASGGADEFETVAGFIEKLIAVCDIDAQKIIIAPGNHDYSRDATHSAYKVQKFEAAKFKENVDYKINDDIYLQRQSEKWRKKFKNFSNKLYEAVYNKAFPSDTSKQIFVMGDKNISFAILNTSTQIDHFYPRKVGFDAEGLIEAQSKMSKESVKIAVGHHPINLEEHYDFVNNLQGFKFTAYMHGHVHRNNMVSFNEYAFDNNKTVNIGSGLFWSKEPKKSMVPGVPYRYNVVKIDKEKSITIETREREKTSMHWRGSSLYLDEKSKPSSIKEIPLLRL